MNDEREGGGDPRMQARPERGTVNGTGGRAFSGPRTKFLARCGIRGIFTESSTGVSPFSPVMVMNELLLNPPLARVSGERAGVAAQFCGRGLCTACTCLKRRIVREA